MNNQPHIEVLFDNIINYDKVLNYFNTHKLNDMEPIEKLQRFEGGFSIKLKNVDENLDINKRIKQLRWHKKKLVNELFEGCNSYCHMGFNIDELNLLYKSLVHIYGEDQVIFHNKLEKSLQDK